MKAEYIIEQKMSGTGTIHDIESDCCDRVIRFRNGCKYAVVAASYYGLNTYSTHKTAAAAAKAAMTTWRDYSKAIIDVDGNEYEADRGWGGYELTRRYC